MSLTFLIMDMHVDVDPFRSIMTIKSGSLTKRIIQCCHCSEKKKERKSVPSSMKILELKSVSSADLILEQKSVTDPRYLKLAPVIVQINLKKLR